MLFRSSFNPSSPVGAELEPTGCRAKAFFAFNFLAVCLICSVFAGSGFAQPEDLPEDARQDWAEMEAELEKAQQENREETNSTDAADRARERAAEIARRRAEARRRAAERANNRTQSEPAPANQPDKNSANNQQGQQVKTDPKIQIQRGQQAAPQTVKVSDTALEMIADELNENIQTEGAEANIRLQYQDAPIGTIVRALSDKLGKPIIGEFNVEGTVTFYDSRLYTLQEAFDTVNILLAMRNYRLIEDGRFLRLIQLDDLAGVSLPIISGMKDTKGLSDEKLVTVLLPLKYIQAEEATELLGSMVSTYGYIASMAKSKSILITDRLGNINRINRLLQLIDTEASADESQMRIIEMKYARASDVASVIENLWGSKAAPTRMVYDARRKRNVPAPTDPKDIIRVTFDDRTNILMLSGESVKLSMAMEMVERLDTSDAPTAGDVRIFQLENASAEELRNIIAQMLGIEVNTNTRRVVRGRNANVPTTSSDETKIVADTQANRLIVSAPADTMAKIESLIKQLDSQSSQSSSVKVVPLKSADAAQVAAILEQSTGKRDSRGRITSTISISSDPRTNTIIMTGPANDINTAMKLLEQLDTKSPEDETEVRVIHLTSGDANTLSASLLNILNNQSGMPRNTSRRRGLSLSMGGSSSRQIKIEADTASNSLIISAPTSEWPRIESLLEELKAAAEPTESVTRIIPLKYADAEELAQTLSGLLGGGSANRQMSRFSRNIRSRNRFTPITSSSGGSTIAASSQANALLVTASPEDQAKVADLVEQLDIEDAGQADPISMIQLEVADAASVAQTLQSMLPPVQRGQISEVSITADARTNSVLVRAPASQRKMIEQMIAKLDTADSGSAREMRVVQLKHVLASDVVPMIEQLYGDSSTASASRAFSMFNNRRRGSRATPVAAGVDESVKVTATPNDTALVIEAPADKMESILSLIDSLDTAGSQHEVLLPRSYSLTNADASELASSLANLFSEQMQMPNRNRRSYNSGNRYTPSLSSSSKTPTQPRFEAITRTNTLLVRATAEQYEVIDAYIREVESDAQLTEATRIFKLQYADAEGLVEILQTMLTGQTSSAASFNPWSRRNNRRSGNTSSVGEVRIAAQVQTNSIIVQGPPEKLELAENLITQFDVADNNGQTITKIVPLQDAKADLLAESINAAISGDSTGGNSRLRFNWGRQNSTANEADKVSVTAETNSNSLIVRGPQDKITEVIELIRQLDTTGSSNTPQMRRYPLQNNDAEELAETLDELFSNIIAQSQSDSSSFSRNRRSFRSSSSGSVPFTITADQRTNSLIVSTTEAYFVMFEQLLSELEQTEVAEREVHYIQLVNADAYDLADQLEAMFMDRKGPDAPVIEVDYFSNSLTIIAKDIDYRRMEPIIRNIDQVTAAQVRVISAGALRAEQLAQQLRRVYPQISDNELQIVDQLPEQGSAEPTIDQTTVNEIDIDLPSSDEKQVAENIADTNEVKRQPVMVAVDTYSNSLIISGSRQDLDSIEDLITQLSDGFNDAEEDVRWFKIEQADVEWVASMLKQLFSTTQNVPARNNRNTNTRNNATANRDLPDSPEGNSGGSKNERPQRTQTRTVTQSKITAVADTRTSHVIVRAKPTEFELVKRLIEQLDTPGEDASGVFIIQLARANAAEMASIIQDLYTQQAKTAKAAGGETEGLAVSSDERANVLILSCSPKQYEKVKSWVEQVEQMNPQRGTPRIIQIKNANPEEVGEAVKDLFGGDGSSSAGSGKGQRKPSGSSGSSSLPFELSVLASQRQLLIVAEDGDFEAVKELVEKLDQAAADSKPEVKIFELKYADNNKVADSLTQVFKQIARDGHSEDSVTITALKNTNAVMVAGTAERIAEAANIITQLDNETVSPELEFRVYQLNHAKPSNIKDLLEKLLAEYQKSRPDEQVAITADDNTRSIIVTARGKVFEQIEKILAAIDIEPKVAVTEVRIVPLKRADAKTLAEVLNAMLRPSKEGQVTAEALVLQEQVKRLRIAQGEVAEGEQLPELDLTRPIKISSDPAEGGSSGSNSLIVSSTPENVAALVAVIEMMDSVPLAEEATIEIFQLQHADAEVVAEILEDVFTKGADTLSGIENAGVKGRARPESDQGSALVRGVNISADLRTNSLIVSGSVESVMLAKGVIDRLDVDGDAVALSGRVRIVPLKYANAGAMSDTLGELFTKRYENARTDQLKRNAPVILPDLRSNSLLIVAGQDDHGIIDELLATLDARQLDPSVQLVVIPLKHNDAGVVGPMLKEIFDARLESMTPSGQDASPQDRVDIATDSLINGLIVSASRENLDQIRELLAKVDIEPQAVTGIVRMYRMENADAQRIAEMLKSLIDDGLYKPGMAVAESSEALANREKVSIVADTRTNVLVVSASRENFAVIEEIIARLDSSDDYSVMGDIRLYTLKRAKAEDLAETLDGFFESKRAAEEDVTESGRSLKVTIVADSRTNTLLVAGGRECFADVEAMLEKLDGERGLPGSAPKVFPLKKANATDIAEIIESLYESQGGMEEANITVKADERTNSIVVTGDQSDLDRIEALLDNLDSDKVTHITQIRIFPLKRAKAEELSDLLTETLTKQLESPIGEGDQKQAILQHVRNLPGGGRLVSRSLQEGLLVTPDKRSNSIVVAAPIDTMPLLENIIQDLDSVESPKAQIKILQLSNSDAEQMAEMLKGVFRLEEASLDEKSMATYQLADGPAVTMGSAEDAILTVTVDIRTNSLVIGGSETYIAMAESVVKQLDGKIGHKRVTQVYRLRNARATDIEEALTKWLEGERQIVSDRLGDEAMGAGTVQLEEDVTVVAVNTTSDIGEENQTSNTLIISASPRYIDTVKAMIDQLDEPQPQVQIDVMLAEVTLDDSMEFGFDWDVVMDIDSAANRILGASGYMGTVGKVGTDGSGLSMSVTGGDWRFFFQALRGEGKLEVVARPHLTVIDNQEGEINIGQRVPFITDIRITDSSTYNTVQYEDVGVILKVTPRISPDGFVRMEVAPEISAFASSSVQISDGVSSPIFNSRKVTTSVSVKDGHTIVIGGLIRTQEDIRETKIPILGDIPYLGNLFRRDVQSSERTELLIVLTPRIITNVEHSDRVTREEAGRVSMSDKQVESLYRENDRNIRSWDRSKPQKPSEPVKNDAAEESSAQPDLEVEEEKGALDAA